MTTPRPTGRQNEQQDTAIGAAWVKALESRTGKINHNVKPTTDTKPVRTLAAVVTVVEVIDFYARTPS